MPGIPNLIGHNYLGPGNPLPNGEPVDVADEIAKKHDYKYQEIIDFIKYKKDTFTGTEAEKEQQLSDWIYDSVQEADHEAITEFIENTVKNNSFNWWALAGAYGLNTKAAFEGAIKKIIYPWKPTNSGIYFQMAGFFPITGPSLRPEVARERELSRILYSTFGKQLIGKDYNSEQSTMITKSDFDVFAKISSPDKFFRLFGSLIRMSRVQFTRLMGETHWNINSLKGTSKLITTSSMDKDMTSLQKRLTEYRNDPDYKELINEVFTSHNIGND
jgi:hypothetical protein